jgi:TusA-related sulfurtransferase
MTADGVRTLDAFDISGLTPAATLEAGSRGDGVLFDLRSTLAPLAPGSIVELRSTVSTLRDDLLGWCRLNANELIAAIDAGDHTKFLIRKGPQAAMSVAAEWGVRLESKNGLREWLTGRRAEIPESAPTYYGFVPRGAVEEPGLPSYPFSLNRKSDVWTDSITDLYEQATAQQWSVNSDIPWEQLQPLPDEMERSVCQVMTFLAENEYAALYIPARFLPRINAQYIEVVLFLGTVINDEARHIEAFTKRALANGGGLQHAAAITEWSLYSLLLQEDYFKASFLLHVLGEGTFLELLEFIERHAPDPVTAEIVRRARLDEGRHVAYGIAHARERIAAEPEKVDELIAATEARASALQSTSSANPMLMQALATLAGGGSRPEQISEGLQSVRRLQIEMGEGRVRRLVQIGLDRSIARELSALHTPNFM